MASRVVDAKLKFIPIHEGKSINPSTKQQLTEEPSGEL
jgi:hypothetical protein